MMLNMSTMRKNHQRPSFRPLVNTLHSSSQRYAVVAVLSEKNPQELLRMIYFAFVHSQILYGIEVLVTPFHLILLNLVF